MNYQQALRFIVDRSGYDRGFVANPFAGDEVAALGLKRTAAMLQLLGSPEQSYAVVHVAGTKGKGSTSAMIEAVARESGLKTGLYVTPHLHTFRERIQIDRKPVSESTFTDLAEAVAPAIHSLEHQHPELGDPTAFEITTVMALLAFQQADVDLAVVEVGMGGRLDATDVVDPAVSVITAVSIDHAAILGDTIGQIATEKAGIIKPDRPVVSGPQVPEAAEVISRIAKERGSPLYRAGVEWTTSAGNRGASFAGPWGELRDVQVGLEGVHQIENAGVALMACWLLDFDLLDSKETVRAALGSVAWPGRFEQIGRSPDVYVDGAHNVDSVRRLVEALRDRRPTGKVTIVFGTSGDKDVPGMLRELAALQPDLVVTRSKNPRAANPQEIVDHATEAGLKPDVAENVQAALDLARSRAEPDDLICITGSLYVVAEARELAGLADAPSAELDSLYR